MNRPSEKMQYVTQTGKSWRHTTDAKETGF